MASSLLLAETTRDEARGIAPAAVALFPVGATEQHGTDLHYFFHIRNTGPARADGVRFTNVLPAGVALRDALYAAVSER